jgi:hypothetical protein
MNACRWRNGCQRGEGGQPAKATRRGHCKYHYQYLLGSGVFDTRRIESSVIAPRFQEHIDRGANRGLEWLAKESGIGISELWRYWRGGRKKVAISTLRRIMAVPLPPSDIGCCRRVHALMRIGWSIPAMCVETGIKYDTLVASLRKATFSSRMAGKVDAMYRMLADRPPAPTRHTKVAVRKAIRAEYASPLAWEGHDIDDPGANPTGMSATRVTLMVQRCEWCHGHIERGPHTPSTKKFCSTRCQSAQQNERRQHRRPRQEVA